MMHITCYTFLLAVVFGFKRVALFSLKNRGAAGELVFPAKELNHRDFDVPEFMMGLYQAYADGPVDRNSTRIPVAVHSIVCQATSTKNGILFKLRGLRIRIDETILSATIRLMVKTIGSKAAFSPPNGKVVLYDQFNHKPLQSVAIQGGEARLVVFPLSQLVKRWLRFPRSNCGVSIRIHLNHQDNENSLRVMLDCTGKAKDNRPLLVVQTQPKPQMVHPGSLQTRCGGDYKFPLEKSHKQPVELKPKSRPSRAIRDQGPCARRPMRVEISKNLPWQSVVVPKFFDAYRCGGDCKFPLEKKVNPSNYAIMQAILHSSRPELGSGEPCCVPIKLTGISTIEYQDDLFSMHFYKELVVEECGCR